MTDEKATPKKTKAAEKAEKIADLEARIEKLERKQAVMRDAFDFAANEVRPVYGMGSLALIFDAIHKKLAE